MVSWLRIEHVFITVTFYNRMVRGHEGMPCLFAYGGISLFKNREIVLRWIE